VENRSHFQDSSGDVSRASLGHLSRRQLQRLTLCFENWHESAYSGFTRRVRGRYWLSFLILRFTGAKIGEVLSIDDTRDVNFRSAEIRIASQARSALRLGLRTVPVPSEVLARIEEYLDAFPTMRGKVFALDPGNFRREFYRRAKEAELPRELSHPHILRHTRAIEMIEADVPLTVVQDLLGHVLRSTTAIYLRRPVVTVRTILEDRGLL
jgi:molybdate transport system regulatory protein